MGLLKPDARYHCGINECLGTSILAASDFLTIDDIALEGKCALVRVDFNVPLKNGQVVDDTRIRACLPSIEQLLAKGANVVLMSHLGRPTEGQPEDKYSLAPVASCLSAILNKEVPLIANWRDGIEPRDNSLVILENVRFQEGEKANDDDLAKQMASLCDVYVNDAFATAHRAQASTHGVAKYATQACAGPLLAIFSAAELILSRLPSITLCQFAGNSALRRRLNSAARSGCCFS